MSLVEMRMIAVVRPAAIKANKTVSICHSRNFPFPCCFTYESPAKAVLLVVSRVEPLDGGMVLLFPLVGDLLAKIKKQYYTIRNFLSLL